MRPTLRTLALGLMIVVFVASISVFVVRRLTYKQHETQVRRAASHLQLGMPKSQVFMILSRYGLSLSDVPTIFDESPGFRTRRCGLVDAMTYCSSGRFYFDEDYLLEAVSIESSSWDDKLPVEFLLRRTD